MEQAEVEVPIQSRQLTEEEAWEVFDSEARALLGMSGNEFIEKYDTGYWPDPDTSGRVVYLAMIWPRGTAKPREHIRRGDDCHSGVPASG